MGPEKRTTSPRLYSALMCPFIRSYFWCEIRKEVYISGVVQLCIDIILGSVVNGSECWLDLIKQLRLIGLQK